MERAPCIEEWRIENRNPETAKMVSFSEAVRLLFHAGLESKRPLAKRRKPGLVPCYLCSNVQESPIIRYITVPIFAFMTAPVLADADPNRRTDLISADLNISEQAFKAASLMCSPMATSGLLAHVSG